MELLRRTLIGKQVICTPYIPCLTPKNEEHVVFVLVRDVNAGEREVPLGYMAPITDERFFIKWRYGGLRITCKVGTRDEGETKTIPESEIRNLNEHKVMFKVDTRNTDKNKVILQFILEQSATKQLLVPMYLAGITASTFSDIPLEEPSAPAGKISTSQASDTVSDGKLFTLAAHVPCDKYYHLAEGLGIGFNKATTVLHIHGGNYQTATREYLSIWKNMTGGSLTELNRICTDVNLGDIWMESVDIPLQDVSARADEVFLTSRASETVSDVQLNNLAARIPHDKYHHLSNELGIEYNEASLILMQHDRDSRRATKECLSLWKNKTGGSLTELKRIFNGVVQLGGIWMQYFEIPLQDASSGADEIFLTSRARPTEESMEEDFDILLKTGAQQIHKDADIDSLEISETSPGKRDSASPRPSAFTSVDISPQDASAAAGEVFTPETRNINRGLRERKKKTNRKFDSTDENESTCGDKQRKSHDSKEHSVAGRLRRRRRKTNRNTDSSDENESIRGDKQRKSHDSKEHSVAGRLRRRRRKTNRKTDSTDEDESTRGDKQRKSQDSNDDSLGGISRKRKKKTDRKTDSSDGDETPIDDNQRKSHGSKDDTLNRHIRGRLETSKYVIGLEGNSELISSKNNAGHLPLHSAARNGNLDCVEFLLAQGVSQEEGEDVVLGYPEYEPLTESEQLLLYFLDKGAKFTMFDVSGNTPIHYANTHRLWQLVVSRIPEEERNNLLDELDVESKRIKRTVQQVIGPEGGEISLSRYGVHLTIPPGALDIDQDISMSLLETFPAPDIQGQEMMTSFGVELKPGGLQFKHPAQIKFPHCASVVDTTDVKLVLYHFRGGELTQQEVAAGNMADVPACTVGEKELELYIDNFCYYWPFFLNSRKGREMICLPYSNRAPVGSANLRFYLAKNLTGVEQDLTDSATLQGAERIGDAKPFFVQWSNGDVHVAVMNNKREEEDESIRIEEIRSSNQTYRDFAELNTENYEKLTMRVFQGKEIRISCKNPLKKAHQRGAVKNDPVKRPTKESREQDFDDNLKTVAKKIHKDIDIDSLGKELGFEPDEVARYIRTNEKYQTITYMGTLSMLRDWRNMTTRSEESDKLKRALIAIKHQRLADDILIDDMATEDSTDHHQSPSIGIRPPERRVGKGQSDETSCSIS